MRGGLFSSRGLLIVAVSLVSLIGGALLAWWQWTRYQSASGTLQNLGYVLQWPLFGVFPAFMFYRISLAARRAKEADEAAMADEAQPDEAQADDVPEPREQQPEVSADEWLAKRAYVQKQTSKQAAEEDQELLAYNQRLAQLSASEEQQHHAS